MFIIWENGLTNTKSLKGWFPMTKSILAYFKSENDAESARIRLQSLRTENLYLDNIPEETNEMSFAPIVPTSSGTHGPGLAAVNSSEDGGHENIPGEDDQMTHLIEGKVREEDYDKAMKIIREANGFKTLEE